LQESTIEITAQPYVVAVRELCEFAAKEGDLDLRFTPAPTAQEGTAGHAVVAARRGPTRQSELRLSAVMGPLTVRGRADGYDAARGTLEEVKTFKGELSRVPANQRALHWAQARVYAAMVCAQFSLRSLRVCLVYFEVDTQEETVLEQLWSSEDLSCFLTGLCNRFWRWAQLELEHRARRDEALSKLRFPLSEFRKGQRALAEHVFKAATSGSCVAAEAGTGIGKTIGTLFPALKAMPVAPLDKVFFLTAKSTGHVAPLKTLSTLCSEQALPLRVLELVSRDSACLNPELACHAQSCPLARGFYDRLPAAREIAVSHGHLTSDTVREIAIRQQVCPYYLAQEIVRWADVVVADYNYYFDSSALLHALTVTNEWRVALLVDEAHNLVERARSMYTTQLTRDSLRTAGREAPPSTAKQVGRLCRDWSLFVRDQPRPYTSDTRLPPRLLESIQRTCTHIGDLLADATAGMPASVLDLYFDLVHFNRLAEGFGPHSVFEVQVEGHARRSHLGIRNIVPAPFLAPRFRAARAVVLFSATLSPQRYYADTLGLPPETRWLAVEPPFSPDQLEVNIIGNISTRLDQRDASLGPIARLIGSQVRRKPGNYFAFFSSFEYLEQARATFQSAFPDVRVWCQFRNMSAQQRAAFLSEFSLGGSGVGFAVLGGAFSEGIDLPGQRVFGVFIATLGLPPTNPVNDMMSQALERAFCAGYDYAYLIPGVRKVVQAAGRVVRGPNETGVVYLIDDRYRRHKVQRLLPSWWRLDQSAARHDPSLVMSGAAGRPGAGDRSAVDLAKANYDEPQVIRGPAHFL
jgi:DNA excision repair protein ERCC-2